jgi:hypothetical protein
MSVVASQSEPPTILPANTAQQIAKLNIHRSDLTIRVSPCGSLFRESVTDHGVYHVVDESIPARLGVYAAFPRTTFGIRHTKLLSVYSLLGD